MNSEQTLYEWIDLYAKGKLPVDETIAFEQRMNTDADFRHKVEEHLKLLDALNAYGERKELKTALDSIHEELENEPKIIPIHKPTSSNWKKYWPITAVAASIALISVMGTLLITRSLETKQSAIYKELRRNLDQIKKSQTIMMQDIAATKEKEKARGNYAGTGFLISANGYIATSYHVIKDADSIYIENATFGNLKASVVKSDPANDIAILKIDSLKIHSSLPFMISKTEANLAEDVYTLGFPREDIVFGEGSISAISGYKQNPNAYQVSVPVNPGNSGGPLLNAKGDLIGMISGIQTETLGAAFAIKSSILLQVVDSTTLDSLQAPLMLPRQNTLKNSSRVQQVKQWRDYVFMVRVFKNDR